MLTNLVQGVGFPVAVTFYLLIYHKNEMTEYRKSINNLEKVIHSLLDYLKSGK